jgi:uncharacterized protein with HEPN domain
MLQAIGNIERHTRSGRAAFERDELLQVYVVHHLIILGEAAARLPEAIHAAYPEVPWDSMRGMRHILVHGYFHIDLVIVWRVVEDELPPLRAQLEMMIDKL